MYILKQIPEDFIVKEVNNLTLKDSGRYAYFKLTKTNRNTLDVIKELARRIKTNEKQIGFAGSKDKQAVTEQIISTYGVKKEKVLETDIDNAKFEFIGYGNKPLSLGDLEGNNFEITIRNLDKEKIEKITFLENYFDEQRFSKNNVNIGRFLVKKDFKSAANLTDNCKESLIRNPTDFVGALTKIPIRLLRMFVNSYQSYIWNKVVAEFLEKNYKEGTKVAYSLGELYFTSEKQKDNLELKNSIKNFKAPLVGFGSEELENEEIKPIFKKIMAEENLKYTDFVIKQIPQITLEGDLRDVFVEVKYLQISDVEEDELNEGKKKVKVSFFLSKGSYATMVVRKLVN